MDIALAIVGFLLIVIGFIGSALPVIPGPPLSWFGYFMLRWTPYVANNDSYETALYIMLFFVILVTVLDYVVPIWGTKKWGGSKAGQWGATIGLILGMFIGPIGIILGPFIGAFVAELIKGKNQKEALRSGWGSFVGFLLGVGMKMMVCATILFLYIFQLFW